MTQLLVENKADVDAQDEHGSTVLMEVLKDTRSQNLERNSLFLIEQILNCGPQFDIQNHDGMTALDVAQDSHNFSNAISKSKDYSNLFTTLFKFCLPDNSEQHNSRQLTSWIKFFIYLCESKNYSAREHHSILTGALGSKKCIEYFDVQFAQDFHH